MVNSYETGSNSSATWNSTFQRYADGNLKFAVAPVPWHDRSYRYDQVGRMTQGLSGKDANGNTSTTYGPYKQNLTYNAFSENTLTTGENWGVPLRNYGKSYNANTGRDGLTGYDAAGNVIADRIRTYPTPVLNRTMKYDAAGRQIETFDPAEHTCCEIDRSYGVSYDGNGWKTKSYSVAGSNPSQTTYDIRSTVLGGETVGDMVYDSSLGLISGKFTAPVLGGKLEVSVFSTEAYAGFTRVSPEGLYEHSGPGIGKAFDPRGADTGLDDSHEGESGGYPASGPDTTSYGRCAEGGVPMPCDPESKFNLAWNRIQGLIAIDSSKGTSTPKTGAGSSPIHESLHDSSSAQTTAQTGKSEPDPEKSGAVDPASVPSGTGGPPTLKPAMTPAEREARMAAAAADGLTGLDEGGVGDIFSAVMLYNRIVNSDRYREDTIDSAIYNSGQGHYIETTEGRDRLKVYIRRLITPECGAAYRAVGLETPDRVLRNGGVIFAARELLNSSENNAALGISEEARVAKNQSNAPETTIQPSETISGSRGIIFVRRDAFTTMSNMIHTDFAAHGFIHAQGIGVEMWATQITIPLPVIGGLLYGHDLSAFKGYEEIVQACGTRRR
jgi:hypothetical protein